MKSHKEIIDHYIPGTSIPRVMDTEKIIKQYIAPDSWKEEYYGSVLCVPVDRSGVARMIKEEMACTVCRIEAE